MKKAVLHQQPDALRSYTSLCDLLVITEEMAQK